MRLLWPKMTIAIVLTLQEVPLRYYYYCGLPLQYYCDTIVLNIYACLKEKIKIMVGLFCMYGYQFCIVPTEKYQNVVKAH